LVGEETSKFAVFSKRKSGIADLNWEDNSAGEVEAYVGVLSGNCGSATFEYYFYGNICVSTIEM
jgi:hypothetical protein